MTNKIRVQIGVCRPRRLTFLVPVVDDLRAVELTQPILAQTNSVSRILLCKDLKQNNVEQKPQIFSDESVFQLN